MRAVRIHGKGDVRIETVPDPVLRAPSDAIVRVTTSAICGSDLHPYHGRMPVEEGGFLIGHEFVGVVEELGAAVSAVRRGDRVLAPFNVSCGTCHFCRSRLPAQCSTTRRGMFGFGKACGGFDGAQAEFVRVPFADYMLEPIPPDLEDERVLFLGDIFSTGYFGAESAGIQPGDRVAVIGCGPVGLCAQMAAQLFGPSAVIAVDTIPYRLELAGRLGSHPVNAAEGDPLAAVRALTDGRGADAVIEAVGHEAALATAAKAVRPGGTVASVGVYVEAAIPLPLGLAFAKDLTFRFGVCNARNYIGRLVPLVRARRVDPTAIITHRLPLDEAPRGYEIFDRKEDNAIKVILKP